jgi:hypothetical protein
MSTPIETIKLRSRIVVLFILGIAILLTIIAQRNFKDFFVPNVPNTNIGNGFPTNRQFLPPGNYPSGQPMRFQKQMWPARTPYMPLPNSQCTTNQVSGHVGCGATGVCNEGKCEDIQYKNTVFNTPNNTHYQNFQHPVRQPIQQH